MMTIKLIAVRTWPKVGVREDDNAENESANKNETENRRAGNAGASGQDGDYTSATENNQEETGEPSRPTSGIMPTITPATALAPATTPAKTKRPAPATAPATATVPATKPTPTSTLLALPTSTAPVAKAKADHIADFSRFVCWERQVETIETPINPMANPRCQPGISVFYANAASAGPT